MIHGVKRSKKVPTPEEIVADEALSLKIRDNLHQFIAIRHKQKADVGYLTQFTEILMELCSDISTIYNFRRELLDLQLGKLETTQEKIQLLSLNLKLATKLIKSDPKSYNVWNFRKWLVIKLFQNSNSSEVVDKELELCRMMLTKDEKNFHVWNYRNWLSELHIDIDKALEFTQEKIKSNPFNYSPYHFRTKHFTQKYRQLIARDSNEEFLQFGMTQAEFRGELDQVKTALFLSPNEEAPWTYYKWLLNLVIPCSVISITRACDLSYQIITSSRINNLRQQNLKVKVPAQITSGFGVKSKSNKLPSSEWIVKFDQLFQIEPVIEVVSNFSTQDPQFCIKPEYGWFFIGTDQPEKKLEASRSILRAEVAFINELLQSQNHRCRYASLCLLDLYRLMLNLCQTRDEWESYIKDSNGILQNLSGQNKGRKYIEKITEHWKALESKEYPKLTRQEQVLLRRLDK